MSFLYPL